MQSLEVKTKHSIYPIYIGTGLLTQTALINQYISGNQVFIVTNETIAPLYLDKLLTNFREKQCNSIILPDGEKHKNIAEWSHIIDILIAHQHRRSTTLLALGGGVIGDITGFAAACYQRGVNFLQIPTTLLAQVDSSIGGKTGVNHSAAKNMIGAFYPPKAVFIDIDTLATLSMREFIAGFAEIIKHALIADITFFEWLESHAKILLTKEQNALMKAITRSCEIKTAFVNEDEFDLTGKRTLLNFGHTFGHALESITNYKMYLHGEAVAIGMVLACQLSEKLGYIDSNVTHRVSALLSAFNLPTTLPPHLCRETFEKEIQLDKKNTDAGSVFIVLKKIGEAKLEPVKNLSD